MDDQELLKSAIASELNKIYTAIPCIVVNVHDNFEEQIVDVQPSINFLRLDDKTKERSVILGVPVIQYGNSRTALTIEVQKGDTVLCIFSMRALEIWQESDGKPSTPNNRAKFHEKDAIALPGLFTRRKSVNNPSNRKLPHSTKDTVLAHNINTANEAEIRLKPDGEIIMNSPIKVTVNAPVVQVNASSSVTFDTPSAIFTGNVQVNQTLTANTDVSGGGKSLKDHIHDVPGIQSGGSTATSLPPT